MLTSSRIYHYASDRCLVPEEHFAFQGWGRDIQIENVHRKVIGPVLEQGGDAPKRKKARTGNYGGKAVDLAGNGMTMPDLAMFLLPLLYSLDCDLYKDDCPWHEVIPQLHSKGAKRAPDVEIDVDSSLSNKELKKSLTHGAEDAEHQEDDDLFGIFDGEL